MNIKRNIIFALESRKKNGVPIVENVPIRRKAGRKTECQSWRMSLSVCVWFLPAIASSSQRAIA